MRTEVRSAFRVFVMLVGTETTRPLRRVSMQMPIIECSIRFVGSGSCRPSSSGGIDGLRLGSTYCPRFNDGRTACRWRDKAAILNCITTAGAKEYFAGFRTLDCPRALPALDMRPSRTRLPRWPRDIILP